jgi:14-3-3 protein epsilon
MKVINIILERILPKSSDMEARAFYLKMVGDYYRYIAENARGDTLSEASDKAIEYYLQAEIVARDMKPYHVTKLSLVLNQSVFYYEVKDDIHKACALAKEALHNAKQQVDQMNNEDAKDALSIVALLKENLSLWKEEVEEENDYIEVL